MCVGGEEDGDTSDSELQAMYGTTSQPSLDATPLSDATPLTIIQSKLVYVIVCVRVVIN